MRRFYDYTEAGLVALGKAVAYWRQAEKPHWTSYKTEGLSPQAIQDERYRPWSQMKLVEILNREFGLTSRPVSFSAIQRFESPPRTKQEPDIRLLELIAALEIMLNPATKQPFTDTDLRAIAKGQLDWETGLPIPNSSAKDSYQAV